MFSHIMPDRRRGFPTHTLVFTVRNGQGVARLPSEMGFKVQEFIGQNPTLKQWSCVPTEQGCVVIGPADQVKTFQTAFNAAFN